MLTDLAIGLVFDVKAGRTHDEHFGLRLGGLRDRKGVIAPALIALFLVLVNIFSGHPGPALAATGINQQFSFTGKLVNTNGTNIADGTYNVEFKIYQDGNSSGVGSTLKWTEDWLVAGSSGVPSTGGVTLTSGTFQVNLGSLCTLAGGTCGAKTNSLVDTNQDTLWLSIQVGNSSACTVTSATTSFNSNCGGDGEMTPYIRLSAVPYAMNSLSLGGLGASSYAQLSPSGAQTGNLNVTGGLTIGSGQAVTVGSTAGSSVGACTGNNVVTGFQTLGGIVVAGTCSAPSSGTLASNYNSSGTSGNTIVLSNSGGGVLIQDAPSSTVTNLFAVQNNGGTSTYLAVTAANSGSIVVGSAANKITIASGSISTASGNLSVSAAGTTTIGNGTGAINITAGSGAAVSITSNANATWQSNGSSLTIDAANGASNSTLTVTNSGAGNVTLALEANGIYAVGASNGTSVGACTSSQAVVSYQSVGGIIVAGSCSGIILNQSGLQSSSQFHISGTGLSDTGFQAPYIDAQSAAGSLGLGITNAGAITIGNTANGTGTTVTSKNSTTAFVLQNQSNATILSIDTTASLTSTNLVANPSFETTISGSGAGVWVKKIGTESSVANNTSNFYNQLNSVKIVTTAVANQGIKQQLNSTLSAGTAYNIIFYAKLDPASAPMATLQAGFSDTGASDDVVCTDSLTIVATGWTKYVCSFTTGTAGSAPTSSNYFFIRQSDANAHTFYIDAVLLQLASSADSDYRDAKIQINGTITSSIILRDDDNSSNALQVQNASGGQVFSVDTTDSNLLNNPANPSFEVNTTGWTTVVPSGTVTIARDTSQQKYGIASLSIVTSGVAAQGARYTLASGSWAAGSYTVSFSMLNTGTAFSALPIVKFGNGSDNACSTATLENGSTGTIPSTSGWTRYAAACTFSGTTTSIAIEQNEATAHTFYIDAVQLETGGTATPYGLGSISLSGQIITPVTFKNQSNSTNAFQVQNSNSLFLLNVNTLNNIIQIGNATTDANAILLALDSYNNATDPTGVTGGMYYNSATSTFRCYQGGAWRNCLGGGPSNQSTATQSPTAGTDTYITGSQIPLPAGGFRGPTGSAQDGSKITWRLIISKTAAGTAASTITIRVGTAGTTSDTARCTAFSTGTPTAVADIATVYITVYATAGGSATTLNCSANLTHPLAATGWAGAYFTQAFSTQTSFDSTPASTKIGLSFNGGTGTVATFQAVDVTTSNL